MADLEKNILQLILLSNLSKKDMLSILLGVLIKYCIKKDICPTSLIDLLLNKYQDIITESKIDPVIHLVRINNHIEH